MTHFFKLLIPTTKTNIVSTQTIKLGDKTWKLVEFERLSDAPPYTCISYSWGSVKTVNPLNDKYQISNRTIPSIETVVNSLESSECQATELRSLFHSEPKHAEKLALAHKASNAIWIDGLCIPQEQSAYDTCIQNIGEIYKESTQVFVVLNNNCLNTVKKIQNKESLVLNDYLVIGSDDWMDRVWTYQEVVNSKMMFLIAEGKEKTFISELNLLNALMTDAKAYLHINDIDMYQKLERMQRLIAAQQMHGNSALQAMSAMNRRLATYPEDSINAMISIVSDKITSINDRHLITPVEYFMRLCEKNNDYSFIFSTNLRSEELGKSWRPIGDKITPIISDILIEGNGLSGCLKSTHLQINNMCRMIPWKTNSVVSSIENFLNTDFSEELLKKLREHKFTGCGMCIKLEYGYFFTQSVHKKSKDLFVAISNDVKFHQGAPALLLRSNDTEINQFCDVGIFIGKAPKNSDSETINIS
jgi:hypothetical protein